MPKGVYDRSKSKEERTIEKELCQAEELLNSTRSSKAEALLTTKNADSALPVSSSNPVHRMSEEQRSGHRRVVDLGDVSKLSIDKHVENLRIKVAYVADKLADELTHEASKKTKKDKEYLKGLVWAFGTLFDKLDKVQSDALSIKLPSQLLANVNAAIQIQITRASELRSSPQGQVPIDITPSEDYVSSSPDEGPRTIPSPT